MKESDLRHTLEKIRPPQSLIEQTCAAVENRQKRPFAAVLRVMPALCAGLLVLMITGISMTMLGRPVVIVGTFSTEAPYAPAEQVLAAEPMPMTARIMPRMPSDAVLVEQPADEEEYLALFRQSTLSDRQAILVADGVVESADL